MSFHSELRSLLNRYSKDAAANTPDYILAEYLESCLEVYTGTVTDRDEWHGVDLDPSSKLRKEMENNYEG